MYSIQVIRTHFRQVEQWQPVSCRHFWRLYYNKTLGARVNNVKLSPDIFLAIPPGLNVTQTHNENFEQFYIHFSVDFPFNYCSDLIVLDADSYHLGWIEEMISERVENQSQSQTPKDHNIYMKQLNLITYLLSHVETSGPLYQDNRIQEAVTRLSENIKDPISNEDLAKSLMMSVNGFSRLFKENTGLSPHQYLLKLRMNKAAELLSHHEWSIDEVASECGFCDRAHFSRSFKKEFNLAPARYRKEVANG